MKCPVSKRPLDASQTLDNEFDASTVIRRGVVLIANGVDHSPLGLQVDRIEEPLGDRIEETLGSRVEEVPRLLL